MVEIKNQPELILRRALHPVDGPVHVLGGGFADHEVVVHRDPGRSVPQRHGGVPSGRPHCPRQHRVEAVKPHDAKEVPKTEETEKNGAAIPQSR